MLMLPDTDTEKVRGVQRQPGEKRGAHRSVLAEQQQQTHREQQRDTLALQPYNEPARRRLRILPRRHVQRTDPRLSNNPVRGDGWLPQQQASEEHVQRQSAVLPELPSVSKHPASRQPLQQCRSAEPAEPRRVQRAGPLGEHSCCYECGPVGQLSLQSGHSRQPRLLV